VGTIDKWAGRPTGTDWGTARPARMEWKSRAGRLWGKGIRRGATGLRSDGLDSLTYTVLGCAPARLTAAAP
jgi:hypothetical protein